LVAYGPSGVAGIVWRQNAGGTMARRLLPFAIIVPLTFGWLGRNDFADSPFDSDIRAAVFGALTSAVLALLIWSIARSIARTELQKQTAELSVKKFMAELADLKHALDASSIVAITDKEGLITYVNDKFCDISGYDRTELIGKNHRIIDLEHNSDESMTETISSGRVWHGEIKNRAKSGQFYWVDTTIVPFLGEDNKPQQFVTLRNDITARKMFERDLLDEKEFNDQTVNSLPGIFYLFNSEGRFIRWNKNFEMISGYSADEIAVMHPLDFFRGDDKDLVAERIGEVLVTGGSWVEAGFVTKDGSSLPYYFTGRRMTRKGEMCVVGMGVDISFQKQAEGELRESENRYRFLFEHNPSPMWVYDVETLTFLAVNKAAVDLYGYSSEEFLSLTIPRIIPESEIASFQEFAGDHNTADPMRRTWKNRKRDGTDFDVEIVLDDVSFDHRRSKLVLANDVTRRLRDEERLRESEERYRLLFENNPLPMWVYDAETLEFLSVNRAAIERYGYSEEEFLAMTIRDIRPPEDVAALANANLMANANAVSFSGAWRHLKKDGSLIEVDITSHMLPFKDRPSRLVLANDVSERNEALRKLEASETLFRNVFDQQFQFMAILDADGCVREINELPMRMTGFVREDFVGIKMWETPSWKKMPEWSFIWKKRLNQAAQSAEPILSDDVYQLADGSVRLAEVATTAVKAESGEVEYYLVQASDVTERKLADDKLRESENRFRTMFELASVGIVQVDAGTGRILLFNEKFREITGYSTAELRGVTFSNITHPEDRDADMALFQSAARGEVPQYINEKRYVRRNGSNVWVRVNATFLRDEAGNAIRAMAIVEDITERRRAEQQLLDLNESLEQRVYDRTVELEAVNKELEAFSYSVSHDLRAPLRAIDGFSRALIEDLGDKLEGRNKNYLDRVIGASSRMSTLIEDLLKLSRISRSDIKRKEVDLSAIAAEILAGYTDAEPKRQVKITIEPNIVANCDPRLLRIALENLLGNAWKFTRNKDVAEISFSGISNQGVSEIAIRDNGAGFDMKYADKLFGAFQRLHRAEEFEGTGIGLATVQRVVMLHGGSVRADSKIGEGSTFFLKL
nr:PAS domain S-box protein [Blastocatellia bacterium]